MITAAQWVPRGFAAPFPQKYALDESEFARIQELAQLQLDDAEDDLKEAEEGQSDDGGAAVGDDNEMEVEEASEEKKEKKKNKKSKKNTIKFVFNSDG